MLPQKLCFVDIETTGSSLFNGKVIEVGVIRVENGKVVKKFQSLINPNCSVTDDIFALTGINPVELDSAPTFRQIKSELVEILDGAVFVAHNVRFDYSFLKKELKVFGVEFSPKTLCSVKLSRALYPRFKHHNLDSLIERFGFECKSRHRAFDDAKILWEFYQIILSQFKEEKIEEAIRKVMKRPSLPIGISQDILDSLPETPGVYIFYGENGAPLYIGKSINIRTRVLSHFSSDHSSSLELKIAAQIKSIETIQCAGELGALIKESELVKKMQPLYNRKLRYLNKMMLLKLLENKGGYYEVAIDEAEGISLEDMQSILGVYKTRRQAKEFLAFQAKEYSLCEKLLGVDKTLKECFGYRLGRCKGACRGKEKYYEYNQRFLEAFSKTRISEWPYPSPILIEEKDMYEDKSSGFLIDKWCYLGKLEYSGGVVSTALENNVNFDLDTYKIIRSYINSPKNRKKIKRITAQSWLQFA